MNPTLPRPDQATAICRDAVVPLPGEIRAIGGAREIMPGARDRTVVMKASGIPDGGEA